MADNPKSKASEINRGHIKYGDLTLPIVDPTGVQTISADVITELRMVNNNTMISLGFGTIIAAPDGDPHVLVASRLRITAASATDLINSVTRLLEGASIPKSSAH
jgi:hypothetical protein